MTYDGAIRMPTRSTVPALFATIFAASACGPTSGDVGPDDGTDSAEATGADGTDVSAGSSDGIGTGTSRPTTGSGDADTGDGGTGDGSQTTGTETGTEATSTTDGGPHCGTTPPIEPDWLLEYQDDLVAALAGADEVAPGVTVSERSEDANRDAVRSFLSQQLEGLGLVPEIQAYSASGTNVYAQLEPDSPDAAGEVVVFGAHFDTVPGSPGANDNATGVAMVLAVARYLTEVRCRTRGFVFVLFDEEEIGLVGSDAFAGLLAGQGLPVLAAHTVDQMGWDGDGDLAIELERPDAGLFALYADTASALGLSMNLVQTETGSTDHVSFRAHGIDAIGITEEYVSGDTTPHYHMPSDTYDTVDIPYLVSTTILLNGVMTRLARGEE